MTHVILDEHDVDRLLRLLYKGIRPLRVHTLICACGSIGDLRKNAGAWNGWQLLPHAKCPNCLALTNISLVEEAYPALARERFLKMVQELSIGKVG